MLHTCNYVMIVHGISYGPGKTAYPGSTWWFHPVCLEFAHDQFTLKTGEEAGAAAAHSITTLNARHPSPDLLASFCEVIDGELVPGALRPIKADQSLKALMNF